MKTPRPPEAELQQADARDRRSIFPAESDRMLVTTTAGEVRNSRATARSCPTAVGGDVPVNPAQSREVRNAIRVQPELRRKYTDLGHQFWPLNSLIEAISSAPEQVEDDLFVVRLFADLFIQPTGQRDGGAATGPDSVLLIPRTVISPVVRSSIAKHNPDRLPESYFPTRFAWNVYWGSTTNVRVDVGPPPLRESDAFLTHHGRRVMKADANGPLSIDFAMRRGSEDDTVILRHDTQIATIRIRERF